MTWMRCGSVAILLLVPATSLGHGWRSGAARTQVASYPLSTWSAWPTCMPVPLGPGITTAAPPLAQPPAAGAPAPGYARPTPAPPSQAVPPTTQPPPLAPSGPAPPPGPGVTESRSFFDAYASAPPSTDSPTLTRAAVGFWNLTTQDLTLNVDGQDRLLPHGKGVRLDLGRQFVWRVGDREQVPERIPENAPGVEIVIRR
jgi:hypothetical protein